MGLLTLCNRCQRPVRREDARRGYDGELYHRDHVPTMSDAGGRDG